MSQRDLFAAAALQGLLAADGENAEFASPTDTASAVVLYADALIIALHKSKPPKLDMEKP
jgi:hypothetical protein